MAEKCRILIADTSEVVRQTLREILEDQHDVKLCCDGRSALELLYRFRPHVLVMDLMLPGIDGLSLLQAAADGGLHPAILATTRYQNDYILTTAYRLGVSYIMLRPCQTGALVDRIQDLICRCRQDQTAADITTQVRRLLVRLGFSVHAKSYPVLESAVLWTLDHPGSFLSKELYPQVGKPFKLSGIAVEKRIRDFLRSTYENRDPQIWQMYFPTDARGGTKCPSNGEFLTRIADHLPTALERSVRSDV